MEDSISRTRETVKKLHINMFAFCSASVSLAELRIQFHSFVSRCLQSRATSFQQFDDGGVFVAFRLTDCCMALHIARISVGAVLEQHSNNVRMST